MIVSAIHTFRWNSAKQLNKFKAYHTLQKSVKHEGKDGARTDVIKENIYKLKVRNMSSNNSGKHDNEGPEK